MVLLKERTFFLVTIMDQRPFGKKAQSDATRKFPRFRAKPLHSLSLTVNDTDPQIKIANISLGGMGLFTNTLKESVPQEFQATLTIAGQPFSVAIKKVFEGSEIIGCEFQKPSAELQKAIDKYFQAELLALKLSRVETKPNSQNNQDKIIFFHGQNNCELLINERNNQVCYFSVIIMGNSIEVDPKKSISSGLRVEGKTLEGRPGVSLFKPQKISRYITDNVIRFIDNIEALSIDYRQNLIKILSETLAKESGA